MNTYNVAFNNGHTIEFSQGVEPSKRDIERELTSRGFNVEACAIASIEIVEPTDERDLARVQHFWSSRFIEAIG